MTKKQIRKKLSIYIDKNDFNIPTFEDMVNFAQKIATEATKELEKQLKAEHTRGEIDFVNMHCNFSCKKVKELEDKIEHLTKHLEPQTMSALFEQVEEEVKQKQRIAELEAHIEKMKVCQNCDNWNWKHNKCEKKLKGDCFKASKWILRR